MGDSTAQTLASGSQDLAALAGLFCTDGVERNALAVQYGYFTVVSSSLSILGILGLVRSAIKVALRLERCSNAGFNLDSIRGLFGYLPSERRADEDTIECDFIKICFEKADPEKVVQNTEERERRGVRGGGQVKGDYEVVIQKTKRFFDPKLTPLFDIGTDFNGVTSFNIGNLRHEASWAQSMAVIGFLIFMSSGVTSWLLLIANRKWDWVNIIAIPGLHISLIALLYVPISYERSMNRPGSRLTRDIWKTLASGRCTEEQLDRPLYLLQARVKGGDMLHPLGNGQYQNSPIVQGLVAIPAILAAVGYVCQYIVLKQVTNRQALIWIGCQAALALLRVGIWILDPSFDDPRQTETEYVNFNNSAFDQMSPLEFLCACTSGNELRIPQWVWEYLLDTSLRTIVEDAICQTIDTNQKVIDSYAMVNTDFQRIFNNRDSRNKVSMAVTWRMCLALLGNGEIRPSFLVPMDYEIRRPVNEPSDGLWDNWWLDHCWVSIAWHYTHEIRRQTVQPCKFFFFNKAGDRLHIKSLDHSCIPSCAFPSFNSEWATQREVLDSYREFKPLNRDDMPKHMAYLDRISVNKWDDGVWIMASSNTVDRSGVRHRGEATRVYGDSDRPDLDIGRYIQNGLIRTDSEGGWRWRWHRPLSTRKRDEENGQMRNFKQQGQMGKQMDEPEQGQIMEPEKELEQDQMEEQKDNIVNVNQVEDGI